MSKIDFTKTQDVRRRFSKGALGGQFRPRPAPQGLPALRLLLAFAALSFCLAGFGIWLVPAQTHQPAEALLRLAISLVLLIFGLCLALWARPGR